MSGLFQVLPAQLFRPLAAPGAAIYADILLTLFAETQHHHQALARESVIHHISTLLAAPEALALTQDAQDDVNDEGEPIPARASAILRYLAASGWLRSETQSDFTQTYIFPDYAFRLLSTFDEIAANQAQPLQGLICSIHDLLQAALRDGNINIRLPEAYRQTNHLINGLKELQHNIGLHIERVLRQLQAREVLDLVFSSYRAEIVERVYHHLQTTDHVSRYRPGIIQATIALEHAGTLADAGRRLCERGEAPNVAAATTRLVDQAHTIRDRFQELDDLLNAIQTRHSQFVDSAVRTVELQLASATTTSGQLHAVLTHLLQAKGPRTAEAFATTTAALVDFYTLGWVDPESLAPPGRASTPFVPETTAAPLLSAEELEATRAETLRQLNHAVSRERVRRYARALLADRPEITSAELPLTGADDLPLLIYLREYGDGTLDYRFEAENDAGWIERAGIGFRAFRLIRTESITTNGKE